MLPLVFEKQKTRKFILLNAGYFVFFAGMYFLLDSLNMHYGVMIQNYGVWLVIINILLNLIMAGLSSLMMGLTSAQLELGRKESKGASVSFMSVIFGIFTYGCTPCVISFLAAVGISFSVMALPFAGLPYKLISLALLILGFVWVIFSIRRTVCQVKLKENNINP